MAFRRGQRIKMLTWFEGVDDPDVEFGKILFVDRDGKLGVATDSGAVITWIADEHNTEVVNSERATRKQR